MGVQSPEERMAAAGGTFTRPQTARDFLSVEAWLEREIPEPDKLLGDLLTTTSRVFIVGRTGLGKTLVAVGLACGIASGAGFLHWKCQKPARVLIVDGEMPAELVKARANDAVRRIGRKIPPGYLTIFARDIEDEFAAKYPTVGKMAPLNTEEGKSWLLALIEEIGGVDVVICDNVMSLIAGDQKDEVAWSGTLDLVQTLTSKRIGQIWLDHTGHNSDRQYGSSTKAWRFDAVGIMTPLPDDQREQHELAFTLSFDHPGKARRRTPENWQDFETRIIRLRDDAWISEAGEKAGRTARKLSPTGALFYRALQDALAITATPGQTTRDSWYAECARTGLGEPITPEDDWRAKGAKQAKFRKYMVELRTAGLIGVDGPTIVDLSAE